MRIVSGKFGSRKLVSVDGMMTRPTSDKVKGAIFSSLGNQFSGGTMLDCYSGTGNMALEAISRGMDRAVCVEINKKALQVIRTNVKNLGVSDQVKVISGNIFSVLSQLQTTFDLVYVDPPYKKEENMKLLEALDSYNLVNEDGHVVIESLATQTWSDQVGHFYKYKEKTYRDTKITYYRKETKS